MTSVLPWPAPPGPISHLRPDFPYRTAGLLDVATRAITAFDAGTYVLHEQLCQLLSWLEGLHSSRIELWPRAVLGVVLAASGLPAPSGAKAAAAYLHATWAAQRGAPLLDAAILSELNGGLDRGIWHYERVSRGKAPTLFSTDAEEFLEDLIRFVRRDDLPALAQAALAHAQVYAGRPFRAANDPTGRALAQAVMVSSGLTPNLPLPISVGLFADRPGYYLALKAFRHGNAAPLIEQYCRAALLTLSRCRALVNGMERVLAEWQGRMAGMRSDSLVWRMLPLILSRPLFNAELVAQGTGGSNTAIFRAIGILRQRGIVWQADREVGRGAHWFSPNVLELLTPVHSGRPFLPRFTRLKGYP